ncbi:MAG: hypothetical protein K8R57_08420 [Verrucomicrobia bacterium]|nr:hypothetical protein [Verrucomicrobiota bacterium]
MSQQVIHLLYGALAPWLALSLLVLGRNPHLSRTRITGSLLLAFFLLRIPVQGWSSFSWIRVLESNPSFTLTGLLVVALLQRVSGKKIFRSIDWNAAWAFGALAALLLYPMGLGLSSDDPYSWGWGIWIPVLIAVAAVILLLLGNRFGIILILSQLGSLLHLQESANLWDALIDPFYGGISLMVVMRMVIRSFRKRGPSV